MKIWVFVPLKKMVTEIEGGWLREAGRRKEIEKLNEIGKGERDERNGGNEEEKKR